MKKKKNTTRPPCLHCNKPMTARFYDLPSSEAKILIGWGYNGNNCFCSQQCGFHYSVDLILVRGGKCPEHTEWIQKRIQSVTDYNRQSMKV